MKKKNQYYRLDRILKRNAQYNVIIGERSNGKTFASLEYALNRYFENGEKFAVIRRWEEDFKSNRGAQYFDALFSEGIIDRLSNGAYCGVQYRTKQWRFTYKDEGGKTKPEEECFAYAFALTSMEHDKGASYPDVKTIIFDEFLTRSGYLPDEFVLFMNTVSTIVRQRTDVKIFMLANTVSQYAPYYKEMGLYNIRKQEQGTIDLYNYGESGLRVAVEYCGESTRHDKESNVYFAFDNPKLNMIKTGAFEIDIYPHLPVRYKPKDILYTFFIEYVEYLLQCEIIRVEYEYFLYIHRKTTDIQSDKKDYIYTTEYTAKPNKRRGILKWRDERGKRIAWFFQNHLVFYQDNEVGEIVTNYIKDTDGVKL